MTAPDVASIAIAGSRFVGWEHVSVTRTIEAVSGSFQIKAVETVPDDPRLREIKIDDECDILLGGEKVLSGYVFRRAASYDKQTHSVQIGGGDRTLDLVHCTAVHDSGQFTNRTLFEIVSEICEPFGMSVTDRAERDETFELFRLTPGEGAFAAISRGCGYRGVLPIADGEGGLTLWRPPEGAKASAALRLGENPLAASHTADHSGRYSKITVKAQRPDFLKDFPGVGADDEGIVLDPHVLRYRPLVLVAGNSPTQKDLDDRAKGERNVRAGRSTRVSVKVQGWRSSVGGPLWTPGDLVYVDDSWLGVKMDLLLASATFSQVGAGTSTTLSLVRPEAFDLRDLPEPNIGVPEFWTPIE